MLMIYHTEFNQSRDGNKKKKNKHVNLVHRDGGARRDKKGERKRLMEIDKKTIEERKPRQMCLPEYVCARVQRERESKALPNVQFAIRLENPTLFPKLRPIFGFLMIQYRERKAKSSCIAEGNLTRELKLYANPNNLQKPQ